MKKYEVVKNSRDFERIIKNGKCIKNNEYVIYYVSNDLEYDRFGISVSKKIGNSVVRNYYKRIIRNICDKNKYIYSKGKDYIIIMRKGLIDLKFIKANDSFLSLIKTKIEKD